jgi:hypothetical protein
LSCLQLFIVSRELQPFVSKLVVDSARRWTVARPVRERKGSYKLVYSDHFPCLLTLESCPGREGGRKAGAGRRNRQGGTWQRMEAGRNMVNSPRRTK